MFSYTTNRRKLDIAKSSKQHVDGLKAALVLHPVLDDSYTPGVPPASHHDHVADVKLDDPCLYIVHPCTSIFNLLYPKPDLLPMMIRQKMLIINRPILKYNVFELLYVKLS
jgi:hypothetical protein